VPAKFRALDFLLAETVAPPPAECWGCPFSTVNLNNEPPNPADPGEGYYDCELLGKTFWGESPGCTYADWQNQARQELPDAMISPSDAARLQLNNALTRIGEAETTMHGWAERYRQQTAAVEELRRAIRELLKGGDHEGPCTNEGFEMEDACELHLRAAQERHDKAVDLLGRQW
jgi:hypothetical protein